MSKSENPKLRHTKWGTTELESGRKSGEALKFLKVQIAGPVPASVKRIPPTVSECRAQA